MTVLVNSYMLGGGDAAADDYLTAAGITDPTRQGLIRDFFAATTAVRPKLDRLYLFANTTATAARTDLILPSRTLLSAVADTGVVEDVYYEIAPTFTADRGYTFGTVDGSGRSSLQGSFDFSAALFNNGGAGCSVGVYTNTTSSEVHGTVYAVPTGGTTQFQLDGPNNTIKLGVGGSALVQYGVPVPVRTGLLMASAAGGQARFSRNGAAFADTSFTAGSTSGTATVRYGWPGRLAAAFLGAALSDAETDAFYDALQTLFTAIGAQA